MRLPSTSFASFMATFRSSASLCIGNIPAQTLDDST
jgi:hypothetical protein